jgi:putative FmdB family regulatory protein
MPTYQYVCTECGEPLEVVQKFSDDPLTVCPACQGRLRKVFSPVGVVFKGSGFYKTDSRSSASSSSASKAESKSSESNGESTSDSKSETKPKTNPETKPETKADSKPSTSSGGDGTKVA